MSGYCVPQTQSIQASPSFYLRDEAIVLSIMTLSTRHLTAPHPHHSLKYVLSKVSVMLTLGWLHPSWTKYFFSKATGMG